MIVFLLLLWLLIRVVEDYLSHGAVTVELVCLAGITTVSVSFGWAYVELW